MLPSTAIAGQNSLFLVSNICLSPQFRPRVTSRFITSIVRSLRSPADAAQQSQRACDRDVLQTQQTLPTQLPASRRSVPRRAVAPKFASSAESGAAVSCISRNLTSCDPHRIAFARRCSTGCSCTSAAVAASTCSRAVVRWVSKRFHAARPRSCSSSVTPPRPPRSRRCSACFECARGRVERRDAFDYLARRARALRHRLRRSAFPRRTGSHKTCIATGAGRLAARGRPSSTWKTPRRAANPNCHPAGRYCAASARATSAIIWRGAQAPAES